MSNHSPFASWAQLLDHVRKGKPVSYKAPFDRAHRQVKASVRGKGQKVRVDQGEQDADPFWADKGHLDRFGR
ncbi:MAG: hypothetical protein BWY99_02108 [Synergistetes bacterium ADurb.BinA166]|nr:MAG: hypothetical protein BWY99_02108 [Synergistetes bacterium ADurb.BinA166]